MELNGKKIVLTGGASGIGKALIYELLGYDVQVMVADLNPEKVETYEDKILPVKCDVSRPENIDALFEQALKAMGRVDIFIANAGFAYFEKIRKPDWVRMERLFDTNLLSPVYAMEKMMEINPDREYMMIAVASAMGKLPLPGYAIYSASKAALDAFAFAFRYEMSDKGRLMTVYPVATRTAFFQTAGGADTPQVWPTQEPEVVARAIVRGILKNKRIVYPSRLSLLIRLSNMVPILFQPTIRIEQWKFKRWLKKESG